jgi:hypothetical protein
MSVLSFEKPEKLRPTEEHNNMHVSDSGIAGTYVPNMSNEDMKKWKAKHIKGEDERIEIRKSFGGAQALIIVYKKSKKGDWRNRVEGHEHVRISANNKIHMTFDEFNEFLEAMDEAFDILGIKLNNEGKAE